MMVPHAALAAACGLCLTPLRDQDGLLEVLCLARRLLVWVAATSGLCPKTSAEAWLSVARCMVFPLPAAAWCPCLGVSAGSSFCG